MKKKSIEDAKQKLSELIMFNINEAFKNTIVFLSRALTVAIRIYGIITAP